MESENLTSECQIIFKTTLPEEFQVPETEIQVPSGSGAKDLTSILLQLFEDKAEELKARKFNFLVDNTFLSSTLHELLTRLGKSNESVIEIFYLFALEKPKPKHTSPQDEWVGSIKSLRHFQNDKAKSYCAGFLNGDLKVFGKEHAELLCVR